jgi:hypothetical protein
VSFAARCAWTSAPLISKSTRPGAAYRKIGQQLKRAGCTGPLASTKEVRHAATYVAYHMDEPILGCPAGEGVADIEAALGEFGVKTFFVSGDADSSRQFRRQTSWRQRLALPSTNGGLFVYAPPHHTVHGAGPKGRPDESGVAEAPL